MDTIHELKQWIKGRMDLFPDDDENTTTYARGLYDGYLNTINHIEHLESIEVPRRNIQSNSKEPIIKLVTCFVCGEFIKETGTGYYGKPCHAKCYHNKVLADKKKLEK